MKTQLTVVVAEPDDETRAKLAAAIGELAAEKGLPLTVFEATSGTEAHAQMRKHHAQYFVGEVLLQGKSGYELLRRHVPAPPPGQARKNRSDLSHPSFLFATKMVREIDRYWALRNGAAAYLPKPLSAEEMKAGLTELFSDAPARLEWLSLHPAPSAASPKRARAGTGKIKPPTVGKPKAPAPPKIGS